MAMHPTTKNFLVELSSLFFVLLVVGLTVYNWDFVRSKMREQSTAAAAYLKDRDNKQTAAQTRSPEARDGFDVSSYERSVVIKAGFHGQFIAQSYVNDIPFTMMADTGASMVMLTYKDAERLGLSGGLDFKHIAHTANGKGRFAIVTLNRMRIGDVELDNVRAGVLERGKLQISLLGMNFINRLKRFEMRGKQLILVQ